MAKKDYYEILGVTKSSDEREIKRAYKRLAIKYHPDRNKDQNTESKFKEIKEAYEVLTDPKKRTIYDQYGHDAFDQNNATNSNFNNSNDFSDIFGEVFGDIFGRTRNNRRRGADLCCNIELTLEESVCGIIKEISIPSLENCSTCKGSGAKSGTKPKSCISCKGTGQLHMQQGFFTVQQTCPSCQGNGIIIQYPCYICKGQGRVKKNKKLSVKIPVGVDNGDRIRLNGEGEIGSKGAPSGDLYVQIKVKKHNIFERENNNLYCELPINFAMAALGGEVSVPTLNGKVKLKIPSETQTGKLFRIRGKGVKSIRNNTQGDLFCRIIVETPVKLNEKQKNMLHELGNSFIGANGEKNSPLSKKFFDGVKKFFDNLTN